MEKLDTSARLVTEGFTVKDISPRKKWTELKDDFMSLHNDYVEEANKVIDKLNDAFNKIFPETEKEGDDEEPTKEELEIADLKDEIRKLRYMNFMATALGEVAAQVNHDNPDNYFEGFVLPDGIGGVTFYGRFRKYPECKVHFCAVSK